MFSLFSLEIFTYFSHLLGSVCVQVDPVLTKLQFENPLATTNDIMTNCYMAMKLNNIVP